MIEGVFLGTGASKPSAERNPSSIFLRTEGLTILLDCGEGTQKHLLRFAPEFFVDVIIISHHHTDHDHGLKPYLQTMNLQNRKDPLYIYTPEPPKIDKLIDLQTLDYKVHVIKAYQGVKFIHKKSTITFEKATHSIPCIGTLIESKDKTRYNREALLKLPEVKRTNLFTEKSKDLEAYRLPDCPRYSLYYSGDTLWNPLVLKKVHPRGLVIHECTFTESEDLLTAKKKHHTHLTEIDIEGDHILTHIGGKIPVDKLPKIYPLKRGLWAKDGLKFTNKIW